MTPVERDELAKLAVTPLSINDEPHNDTSDNGAGQAREVRNKYLSRIGVDAGNSSDTEPLLQ